MRRPSLSALFLFAFAAALFAASALITAVPAHADTYSVVQLDNDNRSFYGMDDARDVVFMNLNPGLSCGRVTYCYDTYLNGTLVGVSSTAPVLSYDSSSSRCPAPAAPPIICSATDNGRTAAALEVGGFATDTDLFLFADGNPPQLITNINGIAGVLAINGTGDIVFDSGGQDEWYEAIDLSSAATPEPASLLLLATGVVGLAAFALRRRQSA